MSKIHPYPSLRVRASLICVAGTDDKPEVATTVAIETHVNGDSGTSQEQERHRLIDLEIRRACCAAALEARRRWRCP
jgi:hypothetical protein